MTPLCERRLGVRGGELVPPGAGGRVDHGGTGDVDADLACPAGDVVRGAQQGEVGDAAAQQDLRRPQDPLLGALGQHQPAAGRAGPVDQVVLEHQRGDPRRAGHLEAVGQPRGVHMGLERAERGLHLAWAGRAGPALDPGRRRHRVVAVGLDREHREPAVEPVDQPHHPLVGSLAEGEHQAGHRDQPAGVRAGRRDEQVGPVAGGDHQAAVGQVVEERGHVCAADDQVEHVAVEGAGVAGQHGRAQGRRDLADRRGGDGGHLGDHVRGDRQRWRNDVDRRPVGDHGEHGGAQVGQAVVRGAHRGRRVVGPPVDHGDGHAVELGRQPGVEAELAGVVVVLQVAADHHHGRHLPLDRPVALDDLGDQLFPASGRDQGGRLGVRRAVQVTGRQRDRVAPAQQVQDRILPGHRHQRAERPDPADLPRQQLGQAECHRRLAATFAKTRDIDTAPHQPNLQRLFGGAQ